MLTEGLLSVDRFEYNGKHYAVPVFCPKDGINLRPNPVGCSSPSVPADSPIIQKLNSIWDLENFKVSRCPVSVGFIPEGKRARMFSSENVVPRTLDMPIKFPGSEFRIPRVFSQFVPLIQQVADYELLINRQCYDEYYCYMTVDGGYVNPGDLQREASCHVDGFQGPRWNPKVRCNHTYTVSNVLPTVFYVQPFNFDELDDSKHNFFFEMNHQVQQTDSASAWQSQPFEITLMDCYTVHRGSEATERVFRYFIRLSFEVRIFDRLGNAHNPLFAYDWPMVERDIEQLGLSVFRKDGDPCNSLFPWQQPDGSAHPDRRIKTKPNLRLLRSEGESPA